MQTVATILLGALLLASALVSANQPQSESSQHIPPAEVYSPEEAAHHHHQQQQQQQQHHHHQAVQQQQHPNSPNVVAVTSAIVQQQPPPPQAQAVVSLQEQQVGPQPVVHMVEQPQQQHQGPPPPASYHSAAAGMIQVVGEQQQQQAVVGLSGQKPSGAMVRNSVAPVEQYGQPESASIPANYKPFGSWGLYIGGNPADGYYTNYYKALGNSVEKQQQQQQQQQVGPAAGVNQVSAFGPMLKQASSSPYVGADYYPFAYSQGELNSGYQMPMAVMHQGQQPGQQSAAGGAIISSSSPAGGVPQVYSTGMVQPESGYAEHYASTKRAGGAPSGQQSKGYAGQKSYSSYNPAAYPMAAPMASYPMASYPMAAPKQPLQQAQQAQQAQQQQLYAYPVPVGSQIVGSQQGVDGAFMPYGVHAFTRYAVKPTMVSSPESGYYYSQPMSASAHQYQAAYKQMGGQQQQQAPPQQQVGYSPVGYYGHPMAQLHYSSSEGVFGQQQQQQQQQPGSQSYVGGQQVGVIDSPAMSSVSGHFVHHPSVQYETSASENNAATVATSTNKATQKSKPDEQQKAKVVV